MEGLQLVAVDKLRCSECGGPVVPCESCPHGFDEFLCDSPDAPEFGEHVEVLTSEQARL